eukprot:616134-Prymnesium_polylepis.1
MVGEPVVGAASGARTRSRGLSRSTVGRGGRHRDASGKTAPVVRRPRCAPLPLASAKRLFDPQHSFVRQPAACCSANMIHLPYRSLPVPLCCTASSSADVAATDHEPTRPGRQQSIAR